MRNQWKWVENEDLGFVSGLLIFGAFLSVISFVFLVIATFSASVTYGLLVPLTFVMPTLLIGGVITNDYESIKDRHAKALYKRIKLLPAEVRNSIGDISPDDYNAMTSAEVENIDEAIDKAMFEFNENRAAVGSPKVQGILDKIDSATQYYRAGTEVMKELDS